ncbi:MAG: SpaH/EbpB family LPXTG-anchored major pilin [Dorea sp.]|nr:SpaH/EbpB family LPXTG-anchored major pilin [Dorea sp.]
MKHVKRLASVLLAMVMVLAMGVTAFATAPEGDGGNTGKVIIKNAIPEKKYSIYKIFNQENYKADGQGSYTVEPGWKGFIDEPAFKKIFVVDKKGYVAIAEGADTSDSAMAEFAQNALAYAEANKITPKATKIAGAAAEGEKTTRVEFTDLAMGYYLVDSSTGALCSLDATTPDATVREKNDKPTVDKEIVEEDKGEDTEEDKEEDKGHSANIGDTVNYKVTITAQAGAENYVLHDTMSTGLTFNNDVTVVHMRGDVEIAVLETGTHYTVTPASGEVKGDGEETFTVEFKNEYASTLEPGDTLVVTYTATINEEAERVLTETNEAKLTFGENNETTSDKTTTKNFSIPVYKFGEENGVSTGLAGAEFVLTKESCDNVDDAKKNAMAFENAGGNVYFYNSDLTNIEEPVRVTNIETPNTGKFILKGLAAGTYYLWETKAPDGYNQLKEAVTIVIANNGDITVDGKTFTPAQNLTAGGSEDSMVQVENKSGVNLPSTGGIGTTIFYIVGGVLVVGAAILLIAKKRAK